MVDLVRTLKHFFDDSTHRDLEEWRNLHFFLFYHFIEL